MRTLEWLIVAVLAAYALAPGFRWRSWLPLAGLALAAAHLATENYRWQMVPLYVAVVLLVVLNVWRLLRGKTQPSGGWRRWAGPIAGIAGVLLLAAPPVLFPVPQLPAPGGPDKIGTVTFEWTDTSRPEPNTSAPDDNRRIMVQIWYPALPGVGRGVGATTAPWLDRLDVVGPHIATYLGLPSFFLDHAILVKTNDYQGAQADPSSATYPVVIYSHGWNGFRAINLNQSEALASRGYIAVAVDHAYGAMVTAFADGTVALNNPDLLPTGVSQDVFRKASEAVEATYAADLRFTLNQLELINSGAIDSPLTGKLDLSRVGVYGHSTGGGATVVLCAADPRCKAALAMDPWLGPVPQPVIQAGLKQPFLAMMSQTWSSPSNNALLDQLLAAGTGDDAKLTIAGTSHNDFTMLPLLTPLAPALGLKGPIEGERGMAINTAFLVAFFDHYLKGGGAVDLPGYPEVTFEAR